MGIRKILETTETNKINDRRFYIPTRVRKKPKFCTKVHEVNKIECDCIFEEK